MSLQDLMKREVGKKYLWRVTPIEDECPKCGISTGVDYYETVFHVTVNYPNPRMTCGYEGCDYEYPLIEGWYSCTIIGGEMDGEDYAVPYTQLHEIKEELAW